MKGNTPDYFWKWDPRGRLQWNEQTTIFIFLNKWFSSGLLFVLLVLAGDNSAQASFVIHTQEAVSLEVKGYSGLSEITLFKGNLKAGEQQKIDTLYQGLGLLVFSKGQRYPVILGEQLVIIKITDPGLPPSFTESAENDFFYKLLTGKEAGTGRFGFPLLMLEEKQLLKASSSIHTVADLAAMKERFHTFVSSHYRELQHSDMLRRLIAQYLMMHEYVDFHVKGAPASDIKVQYEKSVLNGVENWLRILKPHTPEHEVLNYCVSLYYNRSMVTLAHLIVSSFSDIAYCPGNKQSTILIPRDISVIDAGGSSLGTVKDFRDNGVLAFVSDNCPVSMVETVIKARELAEQGKRTKVIVVPVEKLSAKHLAMRQMLAETNMLFVNDQKWRIKNMPEDFRLPLFVDIAVSKL